MIPLIALPPFTQRRFLNVKFEHLKRRSDKNVNEYIQVDISFQAGVLHDDKIYSIAAFESNQVLI